MDFYLSVVFLFLAGDVCMRPKEQNGEKDGFLVFFSDSDRTMKKND